MIDVKTAPAVTGTTIAVRSWKAPIGFSAFVVIAAVLFIGLARDGVTNFRLSTNSDLIQLPEIPLPALATGIIATAAMATITVYAFLRAREAKKIPLWVTTLFAIIFLTAFLTAFPTFVARFELSWCCGRCLKWL